MRRVCCETIPKHWWFFCRLSTCETMATLGKPVTLKLPVNIYPCGTQNHIFNTNFIDLLLYSGENCDQHGNYISTDMPLLVNLTANLMTGTLTKVESNLRWPTSYTIEIKCLHQTLIPY